jgi:hypothetical protein
VEVKFLWISSQDYVMEALEALNEEQIVVDEDYERA